MPTPTDYEEFVSEALEEISAAGTVVHRRKAFVGRRSGRNIVVDASFEIDVGGGAQVLVVVECKRYRDSVKVDDVEESHSKLDDIGAHKGIMVTTVDYQDGAVKTARARGIAIATLTHQPQRGELVYLANSGRRRPSTTLLQRPFPAGELPPLGCGSRCCGGRAQV